MVVTMKRWGAVLLLAAAELLAGQLPDNLFSPPGSEKAWAVVIGISRYQVLPKRQWLEYADADAESFAKYITSGQGLNFLSDHVLTITNEQATRAQVKRAIGSWLLRKVKPGDSVYIFLATHGVVEPIGPRDAYLVAYDSTLEDLLVTGISFPELQDLIQRRLGRTARIILLVDTCRAGKLAESRAFQAKMAEIKGADIFGLLASAPNESSAEGRMFGGGHGAFTYYLLRGLQGEADIDKNGFVGFSEAARYVKTKVPEATQDLQHPRELGTPPTDIVLALTGEQRADLGFASESRPMLATLLFSGLPNTEVYVDGVPRGVVPLTGQLAVDQLTTENHKLMVVTPRGLRVVQEVQVSADPTEVQFNGTGLWVRPTKTRGLAVPGAFKLMKQFRDALARHRLLEPPGDALGLLRRMQDAGVPPDQFRDAAELLQAALEDEGQQVLT